MARPACTLCEENEGLLIDGNMESGEQTIICGTCLPGYALTMAAALTAYLTADECVQYGTQFDLIAANDKRVKSAAPNADGKSKRARRAALADGVSDALASPGPTPDSHPGAGSPLAAPERDATSVVKLDPPCTVCGCELGTGDATKLTCDGCGQVIASVDPDELSGVS